MERLSLKVRLPFSGHAQHPYGSDVKAMAALSKQCDSNLSEFVVASVDDPMVSTEAALAVLACNITRVMNILGVGSLIAMRA